MGKNYMRGDFLSYGRRIYPILFLTACITVVIAVIFFALWFGRYQNNKRLPASLSGDFNSRTFVIDPGHGGEDGGTFADDGTAEKELNLKMANAVSLLFELNGNNVRMTRTEDTLLYDHYNDLENYKGKKKIYDLKNRVRITEEYENPVYIGIHMNSYPIPKYKGLQVYYSRNDSSSMTLAEAIQRNTSKYIQDWNVRSVKKADSSIYILDNLHCSAVLIECGFLSNSDDLASLKDLEYRRDMSCVIFASALFSCIDKE